MMIWIAIAMILTMISASMQIATLPAGRHRKRRLASVVVCCGAAIVLAVSLYNLATRWLLGVDVIGNELHIASSILIAMTLVASAIFTFRRNNNRIVRASVVIGALLVLLGTLLILTDSIRH